MVLLNRKICRSIHADYVINNIARTNLMAKNQTYEKTNGRPMKRLLFFSVCKHCVEPKSSTIIGSN